MLKQLIRYESQFWPTRYGYYHFGLGHLTAPGATTEGLARHVVVRTSRDEMGVVVRTVPGEPLHPVVALMTPDRLPQPGGEIDTSRRETGGTYERHLVETLLPPDGFSVVDFLAQVH